MPPFCHLIWIFGQTLDEFLAHSSYLSKFAFRQYSALCHLVWGFPDCGRILAQFSIFSICHFCENCQLWIYLFCCLIVSILAEFTKYVIFVNPTIMDMPLLSSCFKFCQTLNNFFPNLSFRKIAICQDVPFCYLIWIFGQALMNFWRARHFAEICLFCLNLPFSYYNHHLSRFPSLSPLLRFCQTFGFSPNSPFA